VATSFQIAYRVLETDLIKQTDKERAASVALMVTNDDDAKKLAGHEYFGYKHIDMINGRAGVITYRGAEIVLLFKRKVMELSVGPSDPVPSCEIKDPNDVWVRVNLLDPKVPYFQRSELSKAHQEADRLRMLLKAARVDLSESATTVNTARVQRDEVSKLNARIKNLENSLEAYGKDLEAANNKIQTIRQENENKNVQLVQEVLPSYDTVRMALEIDPENKLMRALSKQLQAMVRSYDCDVIEPMLWTKFDHSLHNAVHGYPIKVGDPRIGQIVKLSTVGLRKGNRVIKAANVAVAVEETLEGGSAS